MAALLGLKPGDRLYSPAPLYHNTAFSLTQLILFIGGTAVLKV